MGLNVKSAVQHIDKQGVLLVYPLDNRKEPLSLWSCFFPRTKMRWEWDDEGDTRVSDLWHLRAELSASGRVVYAKWYQGRATFFSKEVFTAMLACVGSPRQPSFGLGREARLILEALESESPLSTKQIKSATDLKGRANEALYERSLKELWSRLLIVGHGEIDDGAFPSLAIGATRVLFEGLWEKSLRADRHSAMSLLEQKLGPRSLFMRQFVKNLAKVRVPDGIAPPAPRPGVAPPSEPAEGEWTWLKERPKFDF